MESFGSIAKTGKLIALESHILENTLVLEEVDPFDDYHGENIPSGYVPRFIYLVTKKKYSTEKIMRISQLVKRKHDLSFGSTPGRICLPDETLPCIRLRDLESYEMIPGIQIAYAKEGITYQKKRSLDTTAVIQLKKFFSLEKIEKGIYSDKRYPLMFYLEIPRPLPWKTFTEITRKVRQNIDKLNFDAALGALYHMDILDLVRIYVKDMNIALLRLLRDKYIQEINSHGE